MAAIIHHINTLPRGTAKPFAPVVIEPPTRPGCCWWLLRDDPERHKHFGYHYHTLAALMAEWSLKVTGFNRDARGKFYTTEVVE